jgi:hypothetical protein
MLGIKNANVLPEPVFAAPRTSFPARRCGIVSAWISVIVVNPNSSNPFDVGTLSSKLAKEVRLLLLPLVSTGLFDVEAEVDSPSLDILREGGEVEDVRVRGRFKSILKDPLRVIQSK